MDKADPFDEFLETTRPKPSRVCGTCTYPHRDLIDRWVERVRAGLPCPSMAQLWEHLRDQHGYPLSKDAMIVHIRRCLRVESGR